MRASAKCLDLIKSFEGLRLKAYPDAVGIPTIAYGHTRGVHEGMTCTPEMAETWLREDVEAVEGPLGLMFPALTQGQHDALVSLCFNLKGGAEALPHTAPHMCAALKAGDFSRAANELLDINRADGKVLAGLTRRRKAERELFLS